MQMQDAREISQLRVVHRDHRSRLPPFAALRGTSRGAVEWETRMGDACCITQLSLNRHWVSCDKPAARFAGTICAGDALHLIEKNSINRSWVNCDQVSFWFQQILIKKLTFQIHQFHAECQSRLQADPVMTSQPSLRVTRHAEGPHAIDRDRDLLRFDWLDFLAHFVPILNGNV